MGSMETEDLGAGCPSLSKWLAQSKNGAFELMNKKFYLQRSWALYEIIKHRVLVSIKALRELINILGNLLRKQQVDAYWMFLYQPG